MNHIVVSIVAALTLAIATYSATGSLMVSFLAYVATGMTVLMMVLLSGYLDIRSMDDEQGDDA